MRLERLSCADVSPDAPSAGSFNGALVFIGANALIAAVAYLFIVGKIERVQLRPATA
jgi:hypothetical protein